MFVNYEFTFFRDVEEYRQLQMATAIQNTLRTGRDMKNDTQYGANQFLIVEAPLRGVT